MHYAAGLWELFGINYLDQERLTWHEFAAFVVAAEKNRREAEKARKQTEG